MARLSTAARRYAEAAFELARRDGTWDAWHFALHAAGEALGTEAVLRVVENPALPSDERSDAVRAALGEETLLGIVRAVAERERRADETLGTAIAAMRDPVGPQLLSLIVLLVERRRVHQLATIAAEYDRLLDRERGIVRALVTSAVPLADDEVAAIRKKVVGMVGGEVSLSTAVDAALIGGITVRIGDRLVDDSIRGRLERLRTQLLAGSRQPHGSGA